MVSCNMMKKGEIYGCKECGIEIEVIRECDKANVSSYECSESACAFTCCGEDLVRKREASGK